MFYTKDFNRDRIKAMFVVMLSLDIIVVCLAWLGSPEDIWKKVVLYAWAVVFLFVLAIYISDQILLYRIGKSVRKSIASHSKGSISTAARNLERKFSKYRKADDQIRILLRQVFLAMFCGVELSDIQKHCLEEYGLRVDYRATYSSTKRFDVMANRELIKRPRGVLLLYFNGTFEGRLEIWEL